MTAIGKSILANTVSKAIIGVLNIVVIPFYVHFLGKEAYGLVGFYGVLLAFLNMLDLGFSSTLTRSLSQNSLDPDKAQESRNLARSLEIIYWMISFLACAGMLFIAPYFMHKGDELDPLTVRHALWLMIATLVFQFPVGFYTAGLVGLQKQVEQSCINATFWTIRCVGALVILKYVSDSIIVFFWWQAFISAITVATMGAGFWRLIPKTGEKTVPGLRYIRSIATYMTGMSIMVVLLLIFNHSDKAIVSWKLSLVQLGFYTVAAQVAGSLFLLYIPINTAYFPVFAQNIAQSNFKALSQSFHRSCQFMSVFILPFVCLVTLFAPEVLHIWLHKPDIVAEVTPLVYIMLPGAGVGALVNLPWAVQQAAGRFREGIFVVCGAILVLVPSLFLMTEHYGLIGAAITWMCLAISMGLGLLTAVFRTTLKGEFLQWLYVDVVRPLVACGVVVAVARWLWPTHLGTLGNALGLFGVFVIAVGASALSVPALSSYLKRT